MSRSGAVARVGRSRERPRSDGAVTRQSVLAAFRRRAAIDVGGYRVALDGRRRAGSFVTQSMLTVDGRVVG